MFNIRMSISIVVTGLALYACAKEPAATQSQVERGKYLVTFGGCHDCHTPKIAGPDGMPVLDASKLLSGHPEISPAPSWLPEDLQRRGVMVTSNESFTAWAGPWGVSFAINLTPDVETGIGEWSEDARLRQPANSGDLSECDAVCPLGYYGPGSHLTPC